MNESRNAVLTPEQTRILPDEPAATRRSFLLLGAGLILAGCSGRQMTTTLPGPVWKPRSAPPQDYKPVPAPLPGQSGFARVVSRRQWARGNPVPSLMNPMIPVRYITVHHDGMSTFFQTDERSSAVRVEKIRLSHRKRGWGDIGYHFAVDRDGRVWEGRPLSWQGAHVKDRNEGNIGIVALGNFDQQSPTTKQVQALTQHVSALMSRFNVPASNVKTHQEWHGAVTACPGVNLQRYMVSARQNRLIG